MEVEVTELPFLVVNTLKRGRGSTPSFGVSLPASVSELVWDPGGVGGYTPLIGCARCWDGNGLTLTYSAPSARIICWPAIGWPRME